MISVRALATQCSCTHVCACATASGVAGAVCGGYTLEAGGLCTTIGGGHHVFSNIQYSWAAGNLLEF